MAGTLSKPRVMVGLDFGTTFSGFAFAHISEPDKIYSFYDFPKSSGERPYCKTLTGSYYKRQSGPAGWWQLQSWGFPARADYAQDILAVRRQRASGASPPNNEPSHGLAPGPGTYLTRFKLHLASKLGMGASSARDLPPGLTVEVLITDYLREMGSLILKTLQDHYGSQLSMEVIQWCVTVPSIWDNAAKAVMKSCMTAAGLVNGAEGSPHPLIMVLEPEAASFHCHRVMSEQKLEVGDRLLVADIGGGTTDIVVQEVVSTGEGYKVKEMTTSSGGLCGGTYVDTLYIQLLHRKIGPCLHECVSKHPTVYAQLLKEWEHSKISFGDRGTIGECSCVNLPNKLVAEWERYDVRMGNPARDSYDELEIEYAELQEYVFDPIIDQNLELITQQLAQVPGGVKVIVVVGGFAGSPYLMDRIRTRFQTQVSQIISPPNPGSAVCQGAVALALNPNSVASRVSKKTYGFSSIEPFEQGIDPREFMEHYDGILKCKNRFKVYVRKGDLIEVDACITRPFVPVHNGQKTIALELFSCEDDIEPRYTVGEWVKKEGEIVIDISQDMALQKDRRLNVSLYFGRSSLEIKAEALNFSAGDQQLGLPVEVGYH